MPGLKTFLIALVLVTFASPTVVANTGVGDLLLGWFGGGAVLLGLAAASLIHRGGAARD